MQLRSLKTFKPLFFFFRMGLLALFISGCAGTPVPEPPVKEPFLVKLVPEEYPVFSDDMALDTLLKSLDRVIAHLKQIPPEREFVFGEDRYGAPHLLKSMAHFKAFLQTRPSGDAFNRFIQAHYRVYRSGGGSNPAPVLFTGYFEPEIAGSRVATPRFRYPVHGRPEDLVLIDPAFFPPEEKNKTHAGRLEGNRVVPYAERREIVSDPSFARKAKPLAWVEDPVALFFLHVQGSGKIVFPDGKFIRAQYDTSNGRPYRSIGKYLIDQGKIPAPEMSMQAIAGYLKDHPEDMDTVLDYNPSYVFFRQTEDGPLGCINTILVPGRAIASDKAVFPMAGLAFIETWKPRLDSRGNIEAWVPFSRFVLNQDTGGAIKGPNRIDVFWGNGPYAEIAAGYMKHKGTLHFLVLEP